MAQTSSSDFIGKEPIPYLLWRFTLPAMASSFVNCLYNVVDRLYIGHGAGADAMAGLALTFPFMIILIAFGMLIGQGSGAVVSLLLGEKRPSDANKVLGQAVAMFLLFIVTFQAIGLIFLDDILRLFGGTDAAIPYARDYLKIILWGSIFQHFSFGLSNVIRSEGSAMTAMGVVILGAGLNIVLDPIFIFDFGFGMGIRGAALATVLSMAIASVWVVVHFLRGRVLKLELRNITIHPRLFVRVLAIGMSPCLMQLLHSLVIIVYNRGFLRFADDQAHATLGIAAFGIINAILMLLLMPSFGINMGMQPIIGYNMGAKLYQRVSEALRLSIQLATGICLVLAIGMFLFARPLAIMFTTDEKLIRVSIYALRAAAIGLPFIGAGIITGTYYQAIGRATVSIILGTLRQGIVLIPTLLLFPLFLGMDGLWWCGPFSDTFAGLLSIALVLHELFRLKRLQIAAPAPAN